jgi:glycosyltransferase involved in cell wall biosynthesis
MQEPPTDVSKDEPWYEILIHDDASTDGTDAIIREYAAKYPDRIFPIYEEINQFTHGGAGMLDLYNYNRAKGKYIAYCEGDDYWTNPKKMQRQVDFMESHPEYSISFHCFRNYIFDENRYDDSMPPTKLLLSLGNPDGVDIDMKLYFRDWYTQPLTMLFRVSMYDFEWRDKFKYYRDMHEIYFMLKAGKCRLMNFDGGVRNVHSGGIASAISRKEYCDISLPMDGEFYWKTRAEGPKKIYLETLDVCVRTYAETNPWKALRCALLRYIVSGKIRGLIRNIKEIREIHQ